MYIYCQNIKTSLPKNRYLGDFLDRVFDYSSDRTDVCSVYGGDRCTINTNMLDNEYNKDSWTDVLETLIKSGTVVAKDLLSKDDKRYYPIPVSEPSSTSYKTSFTSISPYLIFGIGFLILLLLIKK